MYHSHKEDDYFRDHLVGCVDWQDEGLKDPAKGVKDGSEG
jgi:hypothetical protein